jgi:manganese oxidase
MRAFTPFVLAAAAVLRVTPLPIAAAPAAIVTSTRPDISTNDNRTPAGALADGVLTLDLRAAAGILRPEGPSGPALTVEAFGETDGSPLMVPGPLIRVREGTEMAVSIRNELRWPMRVHGLCERGGPACAPIEIPAAETHRVRFRTGPAGTYHYWATTSGMPLAFRAVEDTQLSGALVVDPATGAVPEDRIFVITDWTSLTRAQLAEVVRADDPGTLFLSLNPKFTFPINGLAWPHTERLAYRLHEPVRWRVVNLSTQTHTMHLHGFHFEIDGLGDGLRHETFPEGDRQRVVTQLLAAGGTMAMTWRPERTGNWMFHCHVMAHVAPTVRLTETAKTSTNPHAGHDMSAGMAGMILGVTVTGPDDPDPAEAAAPARKITLEMQSEPGRYGAEPAYGFVQVDDAAAAPKRVPVPGPRLVLQRGEPVEITLVNRLPEATAIHWHGMELESYYDGVHGWSGNGRRTTPLIEPGDSFVVRFTPPSAGTFMYHTHLHDDRQLSSGLYGPMIVVDDRGAFDAAADHVFVMGRAGVGQSALAVLNGDREPAAVVWKADAVHRVRLINITPSDIFSVTLQGPGGPVTWRPVSKDGAALPPSRCQPAPARQVIGVGETYDFEVRTPPGRQTLWLEVRSTGGRWQVQQQVIVK